MLSLYRIILKCCSFQADLQSWRIITARLYCFARDSENLIGLKYMTTNQNAIRPKCTDPTRIVVDSESTLNYKIIVVFLKKRPEELLKYVIDR